MLWAPAQQKLHGVCTSEKLTHTAVACVRSNRRSLSECGIAYADYTCDHLSNVYTCTELEGYGCSCSGCSCSECDG